MYEIEFSEDAQADLSWFQRREQNEILDGIEANLRHEPMVETRNRKRLRPNKTAEWELRLANFRVFYDVDQIVRVVSIAAIGRKTGNRYEFRGEDREI